MYESTGIEIIEASAKMSIKINDIMELITRKLIEKKNKSNGGIGGTNQAGVTLGEGGNSNGASGCC